DPAQLDLAACHETEEQDHRRVLGWQRTLRLHAAPEFFVEPLDHVRRAQCLPLRLGEAEEREELLATFPQARHHARAAFTPRPLKGRIRDASSVGAGRVDDTMEVVADL